MRLSACLLTFNEERWIDLCIEQMYDYVDEILCLDGGSTDNTLKILDGYDKVYTYVIPQPTQTRGGVGWNEGDRRNIIQDAACGDWILCLGCDELLDDVVWENLDIMLSSDDVLGWGFYRINYYYNFEWHKPIHQPPNGGEVRIYRNIEGVAWERANAHNFLGYNNVRMYDHPQVTNTKHLIHHMHRVGIRGYPPVHNRRDENSREVTEEYVRTKGFHKIEDSRYIKPIKLPKILYDKDIVT
jgi:glycosyltransferase involved in cell wall biosynthesis